MSNLINPYDLGENKIVDYTQKINVNELVNRIKKELKYRLLQAKIEALGISISLTTSKTRFNGERFWLVCPLCAKRVGNLYKHSSQDILACRNCLTLKYGKQRFKGMIEGNLQI